MHMLDLVFGWKSVEDFDFSHCYFGQRMNIQKRLWKTGHFKWIPIFLCIVPLFVPSRATTPSDELQFKLFDENDSNVESEILKSLQTTTNIFADPAVRKLIIGQLAIGIFKVAAAPATNLLFIITNLLAHESGWQEAFARNIAKQLDRTVALSHIHWMKATMDTITAKFGLMSKNHPRKLRNSVARFIHRELDRMLNLFAASDSFVKKIPLLGAPLLITLAQFIALFDPVAKTLIKREAMSPELSCKMSNILLDYRPRTVDARFDKLHEDSTKGLTTYTNFLREIVSDRSNKTIPDTMNNCGACHRWRLCLIDDFGVSWHTIDWACARGYISILRHRIEELFPVELLSSLCDSKPKATGILTRRAGALVAVIISPEIIHQISLQVIINCINFSLKRISIFFFSWNAYFVV